MSKTRRFVLNPSESRTTLGSNAEERQREVKMKRWQAKKDHSPQDTNNAVNERRACNLQVDHLFRINVSMLMTIRDSKSQVQEQQRLHASLSKPVDQITKAALKGKKSWCWWRTSQDQILACLSSALIDKNGKTIRRWYRNKVPIRNWTEYRERWCKSL